MKKIQKISSEKFDQLADVDMRNVHGGAIVETLVILVDKTTGGTTQGPSELDDMEARANTI